MAEQIMRWKNNLSLKYGFWHLQIIIFPHERKKGNMSLQQSGFFNWSLKAIVEKSLKGKVEIKSTEEIKLQ